MGYPPPSPDITSFSGLPYFYILFAFTTIHVELCIIGDIEHMHMPSLVSALAGSLAAQPQVYT